MNHFQDWEPVVFRKHQNTKPNDPQALKEALRKGQGYETRTKPTGDVNAYAARARKLEEDVLPGSEAKTMKLPCLDLANRQELSRARTAKGLSQTQLAQQLNIRAGIVHDIENGKPILSHDIIPKINRILGTHLKVSKI